MHHMHASFFSPITLESINVMQNCHVSSHITASVKFTLWIHKQHGAWPHDVLYIYSNSVKRTTYITQSFYAILAALANSHTLSRARVPDECVWLVHLKTHAREIEQWRTDVRTYFCFSSPSTHISFDAEGLRQAAKQRPPIEKQTQHSTLCARHARTEWISSHRWVCGCVGCILHMYAGVRQEWDKRPERKFGWCTYRIWTDQRTFDSANEFDESKKWVKKIFYLNCYRNAFAHSTATAYQNQPTVFCV